MPVFFLFYNFHYERILNMTDKLFNTLWAAALDCADLSLIHI